MIIDGKRILVRRLNSVVNLISSGIKWCFQYRNRRLKEHQHYYRCCALLPESSVLCHIYDNHCKSFTNEKKKGKKIISRRNGDRIELNLKFDWFNSERGWTFDLLNRKFSTFTSLVPQLIWNEIRTKTKQRWLEMETREIAECWTVNSMQ